jgi:hypothetical protein
VATVALLLAVGTAGGYGLGRLVHAVRAAWPDGGPVLVSAKEAPPEPVDLSGPSDTCSPDSLAVKLAADRTTVAPGEPIGFTATLDNTGRRPCLVDGADASRQVTITDLSGKDRIWSSADCTDPDDERMLLLGEGDADVRRVQWSSVRTAPGCAQGQPAVAPGTYQAVITLADVPGAVSAPVTFTVVDPAALVPSPAPSDGASPSPSDGASPAPSESVPPAPTTPDQAGQAPVDGSAPS